MKTTILKSNFTAGEVSTDILGRADLASYANGVTRLRNMTVLPTGGVKRREGMKHIINHNHQGRLIPFSFNTEQNYILIVADRKISLFDGAQIINTLAAPWPISDIWQLFWTQSADTLLLTHPDHPPQKLTRQADGQWKLETWQWYKDDDDLIHQPYYKYADTEMTLEASASSGDITVTSSAALFTGSHIGVIFRIENRQFEITAVHSATSANAKTIENLSTTNATKDWDEASFSNLRGWPISCCFHQNRLAIGGSKSLPNRLWFSQSSDFFNFNLADGEDDEAIEISLLDDQVNSIRAIFPSRHLQIFSSGGEWRAEGIPLTPSAISVQRQTRIGSPINRQIPPVDVDGATLFISTDYESLREFIFSDSDQIYQASDLIILAKHILGKPKSMHFDRCLRRLYIVRDDGRIATLTVHRLEKIVGWSILSTDGHIEDLCLRGNIATMLVKRQGKYQIEIFDPDNFVDSARTFAFPEPQAHISNLDEFEGQEIQAISDGIYLGSFIVNGGEISLPKACSQVSIGLPFTMELTPLPPAHAAQLDVMLSKSYRMIRADLRFKETQALSIDTGIGFQNISFAELAGQQMLGEQHKSFTGDKRFSGLGWRKSDVNSPWAIKQITPMPCTVLSAATEITVNR